MALTLLLVVGGMGAGAFGGLLGLGGGVLLVPMLTLGFGLPFREAVAISLLAVIVTSSAGAAVYLRRGVANLRLGLTLEVLTVLGAIVGGLLAFAVDERFLAGVFAVMLVYVAVSMLRRRETVPPGPASEPPAPLVDDVTPPSDVVPASGASARSAELGGPDYRVRNLPAGMALSGLAGIVSALLGVGGGIIKVPTMHLVMGLPLRAATATSNLTIGVTASASAILYVTRDAVDPVVAAPVLVGTFLGATGAARLAPRVSVALLRSIFVLVLLFVAVQMAIKALSPVVAA